MGAKGDDRNGEAFRRKVRELLAAGYSVAGIMKETGKSYVHTKRIVDQESNKGADHDAMD